jgi:hypothetical protein
MDRLEHPGPPPLDGDTRSSYVTLHFVADPPIAKAARIKLSFRGDVLKLQWPNKHGTNRQSANLHPAGENTYIFARSLTGPDAEFPVYYVRIKFRC